MSVMEDNKNPTMEEMLLKEIAEKDAKIQVLEEKLEITQAVVDVFALGGTLQ